MQYDCATIRFAARSAPHDLQRKTRLRHSIAGLLFVLALAPQAAAAGVAPDHDRCDLIGSSTSLPGFTAAAVEEKPNPKFPKKSLKDATEGWVLLEYAVAADGKVRDVAAIDAIGPRYFVNAAIEATTEWRYKAATRNGAPTDQTLYQTSVLFVFEDSGRSTAHVEFVRKYNRARDLLNDGNTDEAIELLEMAFKGRLNLYEAAMGSFALALGFSQKKDWPRALYYIRHAVINDRQYLVEGTRVPALTTQLELEFRNGNYTEALCAYDRLRTLDAATAKGESPAAKMAAQIKTALGAKEPLAIDATLSTHPLVDGTGIWRHRLLRSKFSFTEIKGNVKSFKLACVGSTMAAAVTLSTQWTVPEKAGACILRVDGDPGASFKLVQSW